MNKKLIAFMLCSFFSIAAFVACDDEKSEYIRPQFGAIQSNPSPAIPGDSLELICVHQAKGNGIASTTYTWTIQSICLDQNGAAKDTILKVEDNYDGYGKRDPRVKFLLPRNTLPGNYRVIMRASFSVYIGSTLFDEVSVRGQITVK